MTSWTHSITRTDWMRPYKTIALLTFSAVLNLPKKKENINNNTGIYKGIKKL